jgi:alpha-tubulin suppressor-like RCC1 family protein
MSVTMRIRGASGMLLWLVLACGDDGGDGDGGNDSGPMPDVGRPDTTPGEDAGFDAGPPPLVPLTGVEEVSAGGRHACARLTDGSVVCWGADQSTQLGDGLDESRPYAAPSMLPNVTRLALGGWHSCGLAVSGPAACLGENRNGQSGGGDRFAPLPVLQGDAVTAIAAGTEHTCAIFASSPGRPACWGDNDTFQLGRSAGELFYARAVELTPPFDAVDVAAGRGHSCALRSTGAIECWGLNSHGQLGNGDRFNRTTTVAVAGVADATAVAAGGAHTCALHATGEVSCWGSNASHQVGQAFGDAYPMATRVAGLAGVGAVTAGFTNTCVQLTSGEVRCFGANNCGQLGLAPDTPTASPMLHEIAGLTGVLQISAGYDFICAARDDGTAVCWGCNDSGQLGDGTTTLSNRPVTVLTTE